MSTQVNVAFVQQFSDTVIRLAQQGGSRLRGSVMEKMVTGKAAHFDRMGPLEAIEITSRHADTVYSDTPHSRRKVTMNDYALNDLIDRADDIRLLIDLRAPYAKNMADGLGRKMDSLIIAAAGGNSVSVDSSDATSTVALPSTQIVDEDFGTGSDSNLTLEKLIEAKRILDRNEVDYNDRYFVHNASALANLLGDTTVTSADYNSVKALVRGEIDSFMGFKFISTELLEGTADGTDGAPVKCLAYHKSGIGLAMGRDISLDIIEKVPGKNLATQVTAQFSAGAVRVEEEKVVSVECVQAA